MSCFLLFVCGGAFLTGCKNSADGGVGGGGGGGGGSSDGRSLSNTNILGKTDVTITGTKSLKEVLDAEGFLNADGTFKVTPPNPNPNAGSSETFQGVLLIKRADGTTKYVKAPESSGKYSLSDNPDVEEGVQVVAVYSDKTIKNIKIEIEPGKIIEVPVSISNGSDPTLKDVQDALTKYGIKPDLIEEPGANIPKKPPYTYIGVATSGTTPLGKDAPVTGDLTLIFQKNVTFTVKINGEPDKTAIYTVTHPATGETLALSAVLSKAGVTAGTPTAPTGKKFDSWTVSGGQGSIKNTELSKTVTSENNTVIEAVFVDQGKESKNFTIKVPKSDGSGLDDFTVPVVIDETATSTTWGEIVKAAKTLTPPVNLDNPPAPAGYTFTEWQKGGTKIESGTPISTGDNNIQPVFKKNISYTVNNGVSPAGTYNVDLIYPTAKETKTLSSIFHGCQLWWHSCDKIW